MPKCKIVFYKELDNRAPVVEWLRDLQSTNRKAWSNCAMRIHQLAIFGHELKRPAADYLGEGIYELRIKYIHVQFRLLYFFHGREVAVLAHSIIKADSAVPPIDIERAKSRKLKFESNLKRHVYEEKIEIN